MKWRPGLPFVLVSAALVLGACAGSNSPAGSPPGAGGSNNPREVSAQQPAGDDSSQVSKATADRKITRTASLRLSVENVGETFQEVGRVAAAEGGFVAGSAFSNDSDAQTASLTVRVPADRFDETMASLRGLASKVAKEESQAIDQTQEYTDLGSRLRNLEATEAQYLEFMKRTDNISDVLQVQDRLNSVRGEIEQVRGRMNMLDNLSDMATITLTLQPPTTGGPARSITNPADAAAAAFHASLTVIRVLVTAAVALAAFSWWLVPAWIAIAAAAWRVRTRRTPAEQPRQPRQ